MSFINCLDGLVRSGTIGKDDADRLLADYSKLRKRLDRLAGETDADRLAREAVAKKQAAIARENRRQLQLHIAATAMANAAAARTPNNPAAGYMEVMQLADVRIHSVRNLAHAMLGEAFLKLRPRLLGAVRATTDLRDFVRVLYGEKIDNPVARALAEAWTETAGYLRLRFNRGGGHIAGLDNEWTAWRIPQHSEPLAVRRLGYKKWRALISNESMQMMANHHDVFTFELEQILPVVYETLATDGLAKVKPGAVFGRGRLGNQMDEHRFLLFATAEDWLRYHQAAGADDIFAVLVGHVERMARSIGRIEVLGPHDRTLVRYMRHRAEIAEALADRPIGRKLMELPGRFFASPSLIEHTHDVLTGAANATGLDWHKRQFAAAAQGTRNLLSTAQLTFAPISALTDHIMGGLTAHFNGLPLARQIWNYVKMLNPADAGDRRRAVALGLGAEAWLASAHNARVGLGEILESGWTSKLATGFHWMTGLTPHDRASRAAIGMNFLTALGEHAGTDFAALPRGLRAALERYGVDAARWDTARTEGIDLSTGAPVMDVVKLMRSGSAEAAEAGQALHDMIITETQYALPMPNAAIRAAMLRGTRPGSLWGEVARSMTMYKGFGVSVLSLHLQRGLDAFRGRITGGSQLGYLPAFFVGTLLMGALVVQLREIGKGRDPRRMDTPEFWGAAMLQGGGFGIYGDFLSAATSRAEGSLAETLGGPVVGLGTDVSRLVSRPARQWYTGDDVTAQAEALRFVSRNSPGVPWYAHLVWRRLVWDALARELDPNAAAGFRRLEQRAFSNRQGQRYWWAPGKPAPPRGPDLGAVAP